MPKSIQASVTLLENLHIIVEKTPAEDLQAEIFPMLFSSFESTTLQVQVIREIIIESKVIVTRSIVPGRLSLTFSMTRAAYQLSVCCTHTVWSLAVYFSKKKVNLCVALGLLFLFQRIKTKRPRRHDEKVLGSWSSPRQVFRRHPPYSDSIRRRRRLLVCLLAVTRRVLTRLRTDVGQLRPLGNLLSLANSIN